MPRFQVIGKGIKTNRRRKRVYRAYDKEEALQKAKEDETQVEEIVELPPEPATDRQKEYAKGLGLVYPETISKWEMSDLLSFHLDEDSLPAPHEIEYAKHFKVETTKYVGRKKLFKQIHHSLDGRNAIIWFCYRIYRTWVKKNPHFSGLIKGLNDPILLEIAQKYENDERLLNSIYRYDGDVLIKFATNYYEDGGSVNTIAYKTLSRELKTRFGIGTIRGTKEYYEGYYDPKRETSLPEVNVNLEMYSNKTDYGTLLKWLVALSIIIILLIKIITS